MRTPFFPLLVILLGLFSGCGDSPDPGRIADGPQEGEKPDHEVGEVVENEMDGLFYDDQIVELKEVDPAFRRQVQEMVDDYLGIKNALVKDDLLVAKTHAQALRDRIAAIDTGNIPEGGLPVYEQYIGQINESLEDMATTTDMDAYRTEFAQLSRSVATLMRQFGVLEKDHYLQFCPMALDNRGAYWISEEEEIRNPYFGDKMLRCGEVKDTYTAQVE